MYLDDIRHYVVGLVRVRHPEECHVLVGVELLSQRLVHL